MDLKDRDEKWKSEGEDREYFKQKQQYKHKDIKTRKFWLCLKNNTYNMALYSSLLAARYPTESPHRSQFKIGTLINLPKGPHSQIQVVSSLPPAHSLWSRIQSPQNTSHSGTGCLFSLSPISSLWIYCVSAKEGLRNQEPESHLRVDDLANLRMPDPKLPAGKVNLSHKILKKLIGCQFQRPLKQVCVCVCLCVCERERENREGVYARSCPTL